MRYESCSNLPLQTLRAKYDFYRLKAISEPVPIRFIPVSQGGTGEIPSTPRTRAEKDRLRAFLLAEMKKQYEKRRKALAILLKLPLTINDYVDTNPQAAAVLQARATSAVNSIVNTAAQQFAQAASLGYSQDHVFARRDEYKAEQIWLHEIGRADFQALTDYFIQYPGLGGRTSSGGIPTDEELPSGGGGTPGESAPPIKAVAMAHVEPGVAVEEICDFQIGLGSIPVSEIEVEMPAHPNCPHLWILDDPTRDVIAHAELFIPQAASPLRELEPGLAPIEGSGVAGKPGPVYGDGVTQTDAVRRYIDQMYESSGGFPTDDMVRYPGEEPIEGKYPPPDEYQTLMRMADYISENRDDGRAFRLAREYPEVRERQVADVIKGWQQSSTHGASAQMQRAANIRFGGDLKGIGADDDAMGLIEASRVIDAMYASTQAQLAADGVKELTLYRGLFFGYTNNFEDVKRTYGEAYTREFMSHPLSSWSVSPEVAKIFAAPYGGGDSYVLSMTVPASRVFSSSMNGLGAASEGEYVLVGARVPDQISVRAYPSNQGLEEHPSGRPVPIPQVEELPIPPITEENLNAIPGKLDDMEKGLLNDPQYLDDTFNVGDTSWPENPITGMGARIPQQVFNKVHELADSLGVRLEYDNTLQGWAEHNTRLRVVFLKPGMSSGMETQTIFQELTHILAEREGFFESHVLLWAEASGEMVAEMATKLILFVLGYYLSVHATPYLTLGAALGFEGWNASRRDKKIVEAIVKTFWQALIPG